MCQSFSGTLRKWFLDNFPMFADSFSVVSIHCVAQGLGANFRYKCFALCGGSLRQCGLLVEMCERTDNRQIRLKLIG